MKNPLKIFTIGSSTFDIFMRPTDQEVMELTSPTRELKQLCLDYGAKVKVDEIHETFGGGATNTAVGFARIGFDACPITKVGSSYGDQVIENLVANNVNTKFVHKTKRDKTGFSTILNIFDGDRTVLAYPGANQYLSVKDLPLNELKDADFIYLGHLAKSGKEIPNALLKILNKNPDIKLAWNPGHEQFLKGVSHWKKLLKKTEILFLNKDEAAEFSRMHYELAELKGEEPLCHVHARKGFLPPYADDVTEIMLKFLQLGVKYVVITDGRNGVQATDGKMLYFCPVVSKNRVDTLGAGDAFATGFSSAVLLGKSLKASLIYGTLNAGSVVTEHGAQAGLLTNGEIKKAAKSTDLCVTSTKLPN